MNANLAMAELDRRSKGWWTSFTARQGISAGNVPRGEAHRDAAGGAIHTINGAFNGRPLPGDPLHFLADLGAVRRACAPDCFGIDTDKLAGPALRDIMIPHGP